MVRVIGTGWPAAPAGRRSDRRGELGRGRELATSTARARIGASQGAGRGAMHARGGLALTAAELQVLGWLSEQYAAPLVQVAVAMGRAERSARRSVARLRAAGLVEASSVLARGGVWVWLTARGQRLAQTGFSPWRMRPGLLAHVAAVNEVRLHIARRAPEAVWVCERQLARDAARRDTHLPDALVLVGAERHAIEVELTPKARVRTTAIVAGLVAGHDAVVYFCAPRARPALDELAAGGQYPKLVVRDLPTAAGA